MQVNVRIPPPPLSEEDIRRIEAANPGWKLEIVDGVLVMSPPTSPEGDRQNANLTGILRQWGRERGYQTFGSSGGFRVPNGDVLSPDTALMSNERWGSLTREQRNGFGPVPELVVELVSKTDSLRNVREKCERWRRDGASYVLLLDPENGIAEVWGSAPHDFPDPQWLLQEIVRED
jgi:Uma2 family endonuclease